MRARLSSKAAAVIKQIGEAELRKAVQERREIVVCGKKYRLKKA